MISILIKGGNSDTEQHTQMPGEDEGKDGSDASTG